MINLIYQSLHSIHLQEYISYWRNNMKSTITFNQVMHFLYKVIDILFYVFVGICVLMYAFTKMLIGTSGNSK